MGELARRVLVAAIGIPLALLLLYLGNWWLGLVLVLIAALGANELYALAAAWGVAAFRGLGAALAAGLVAFAVANVSFAEAATYQWAAILVAVLLAGVAALAGRGIGGRPLATAAVTVFGAAFVGGTLAFVVFLRNLAPDAAAGEASWTGTALVAYPLAVTWVGDSAAYFIGTRWGRHRLSPAVSPKKSVEGAVAGLVGSVLAGVLWAVIVERALGPLVGPVLAGAGAVLLAAAGQVGDLVESLYKREAGVKDSGNILPGHGGVLDRFDALFYAVPVAYAYLVLVMPHPPGAPWQ